MPSGEVGKTAENLEESRERQPVRIGLFVNAGAGNLGNDASLEAIIAEILQRRPNAILSCICANPDVVARRFNIPCVSSMWPLPRTLGARIANRASLGLLRRASTWWQTFRHLKDLDVLLMPGTGVLDDCGDSPFGMPFHLFTWCACARLRRVRIAFVSVGAGPILNRVSRKLMVAAARMADYRSYRDRYSMRFLEDLAVDTRRDSIFPDLVFGLTLATGDRDNFASPQRRRVIGLSIMDYYGWSIDGANRDVIHATYIAHLVSYIHRMLMAGREVHLSVGNEDRAAVDELKNGLAALGHAGGGDMIVTNLAQTLHEHGRHLAEADLIVTMRYHSVVAAIMLNRPVIALGYSQKFDDLMNDAGLGDYCHHCESLNVEQLVQQTDDLLSQSDAVERKLSEVVANFRSRLVQQADQINDVVLR